VLVSDIITQVKIDLRQDGTGGFTGTQFLYLVQEGYDDFVRYTSAREKLTTRTVATYQSLVALPDDFLEGRQTRWSYNLLLYPKTQRHLYYDTREWHYKIAAQPTNLVYWNYDNIRLYPTPTAAGTITFRHSYVDTTPLQTTSEPGIPIMWHSALVDYVVAECLASQRKYEESDQVWMRYLEKRSKAKAQFGEGQRTPDTLQGMRPKTNFNWQLWNQRTL
jgi:hypothetical protein